MCVVLVDAPRWMIPKPRVVSGWRYLTSLFWTTVWPLMALIPHSWMVVFGISFHSGGDPNSQSTLLLTPLWSLWSLPPALAQLWLSALLIHRTEERQPTNRGSRFGSISHQHGKSYWISFSLTSNYLHRCRVEFNSNTHLFFLSTASRFFWQYGLKSHFNPIAHLPTFLLETLAIKSITLCCHL